VRETFVLEWPEMDRPEDKEEFRRWVKPHYAATGPKPDLVDRNTEKPIGWRPSIHMPRWASRITLPLTSIRVERLQDISEEDAKAEGANPWKLDMDVMENTPGPVAYRTAFRHLWSSINGPESWEANPWVWVLGWDKAEIR
jgi:hypothetical protein